MLSSVLFIQTIREDSVTEKASVQTPEKLGVCLIDYDYARIDYRGIDLGTRFFNFVHDWINKVKKIIPDAKLPTLNERKAWLINYQQEIKHLKAWENFDEHGVDSIDNLLIESLYGSVHFMIFFSLFTLSMSEAV